MIYTCRISGNYVAAYSEGIIVGVFDYETFFTDVISPKEFAAYEKNPEKRRFYIRKIDFNNHKIHTNDLQTLY